MSTQSAVRDNGRYRRILLFFALTIFHIIWWDLLLKRLPLMGSYVLETRPVRWRRHATQFRHLAIDLGGVMIKLGQFLSVRVDVLPAEITEELQGLQDEVPAVPSWQIFETLRSELGSLSARFAKIEEQPLAAASLGQAHRAWLLPTATTGSLSVIIKVQRPNIERIVQTDLEALRIVAHWIMRYRPLRRRADVPALMDEFAKTLWEELDYESEARHAERFAEMFADDQGVYIPAVYRQHCTRRVIVLEDVESIKITDLAAMTAAGIDQIEVADRFFDVYFRQIFRERFFHADPHPGNLFVRPVGEERLAGEKRPFQLIFIDFGMVGRVPASVGDNLTKVLISVTQRDARQLTEAYKNLGFFLPGADYERIIEAQETVLERIWGRNLLELARPDPKEVQELGQEFRDLLFDFPFQIPQDFIYLGRAMSMMSGLVSLLNPTINPWYLLEKYGEELIAEQVAAKGAETVGEIVRPYLAVPGRLLRLLQAAENGRLQVQSQDRELHQRLERVEKRLSQLNWTVLTAAGMVAAAVLASRKVESHDTKA